MIDAVEQCWSGKELHLTGNDDLFMKFTVTKHGRKWDVMLERFQMKGPTLERLITSFITLI